MIPDATKGEDVTAYIGGQTAGYIDLAARIADKLPSMIAIVVALSFVVLLIAFRSLLVPSLGLFANLLSVAAAYGIVTFVFQEGHGASLIGLEGAVAIVSYVPLLMFAILFGLSMDYEVFLMTQIQEHYKESERPNSGGRRRPGFNRSGDHVGSADHGERVFSSFVLTDDAVIKQFGIGLAAAIAIDATIVRCLFVPAVMTPRPVRVGVAANSRPGHSANLHRGRGLLHPCRRARGGGTEAGGGHLGSRDLRSLQIGVPSRIAAGRDRSGAGVARWHGARRHYWSSSPCS